MATLCCWNVSPEIGRKTPTMPNKAFNPALQSQMSVGASGRFRPCPRCGKRAIMQGIHWKCLTCDFRLMEEGFASSFIYAMPPHGIMLQWRNVPDGCLMVFDIAEARI